MSGPAHRIQVIGYGNPGRQDDGLGPMFVKALRERRDDLSLSDPYQLTVEDALSFTNDSIIVFVDAAKQLDKPFDFTPAHPSPEHGLSSHILSPESLLQLTETVFGVRPTAYVLAIKGQEFDRFEESLTDIAQQHLNLALAFFTEWLDEQRFSCNSEKNCDEARHA